jgi:hypothetical protein
VVPRFVRLRRSLTPSLRRLSFPAGWREALDHLVNPTYRFLGRGPFKMWPPVGQVYPVEVVLPDGRRYAGRMRRHVTNGRVWYEGFLEAEDADGARCDETLNADGALPPNASVGSLWPRQITINTLPPSRRGSAFVGRLWVSARDGRPGGEVYSVVADSGWGLPMVGYVALKRR